MKARAIPKVTRIAKMAPTVMTPVTVMHEKREAAGALGELAERHDQPPVEAIGDRAGDENEEQRRQELDQADEAEVEGIAREVVDLPADGDADHQRGEAREQPRRPEEHEAPMAKRGPARSGRVLVAAQRGLS